MTNRLIYCFVDIETDGPVPGEHSLLSFACIALTESGHEIDSFSRNLHPLEGAEADPETAAWWQAQPATWDEITTDRADPASAIPDFTRWLEGLPGEPVFAADPLIFDALWIDWYLRHFAGQRLFKGPYGGKSLFVGTGIDIPSFVQAAMGLDYFRERPEYPPELLDGVPHSHLPIDDARGHAALFFKARPHNTQRKRI